MSMMTVSSQRVSNLLNAPTPVGVARAAAPAPEATIPSDRRIPGSTYRLQFNRSFTFRDASAIIRYLSALGITHVYASPHFKARAGSRHGYDILDHSGLNPELGSAADYEDYVSELHAHNMGQVLDVVPNHMGVASPDNVWWLDVLENGPSSPYAAFFDIDWMPLKPDLAHKVLLPVLGDQFGKVLEDQQLVLTHEDGAFWVKYFEYRYPVATRSLQILLRHRIEELESQLGGDHPHLLEYHSILTAISHLPPRTETNPEKVAEARREKEVIKRRILELSRSSPDISAFIAENVQRFNGTRGGSRSFDLLEQLLAEQAYRLAYWRVAADEINYRRFFDINELAAVCMENPEVFQKAHAFVFQLLADGKVDGLRIDHPDGLFDPAGYLNRLQQAYEAGTGRTGPMYLIVEKILEPGERLPERWPVHGTTGYEFLNTLNGIFVDRSHAREFDRLYAQFTHGAPSFRDLVYESKKLIMQVSMSSEISVLGHQLDRISEQNRWSRDFTLNGLTNAISEIIACFPVYRTYTSDSTVSERDRQYVETAVARAKRKNPATSASIFDFIRDTLLLKKADNSDEASQLAQRRFVGKFQQLTGPVMAKGVEDTAFYIYNRLVSLNEVGGDPDKFGVSVATFHQQNLERRVRWPHSLLTTATHDTKRGEDVRARINVLSEIPQEWRSHVFRWARWNQRKKATVDGELAPGRNEEYLLYQILVGTWPAEPLSGKPRVQFVNRIQQYMIKALREAKVHTSWISPNEPYERAMHSFVADILAEKPRSAFLSDFEPFARQIAEFGICNSLAQALLKLTSPGVPDMYQGAEIWDFRLVDPDNRQPIDYELRSDLLDSVLDATSLSHADITEFARELVSTRYDGRIKLYAVLKSLHLRRRHPTLFISAEYMPLEAAGQKRDHVCAFARIETNAVAVTVVPRLSTRLAALPGPPLGDVWGDTTIGLPSGLEATPLRNLFTGEIVQQQPGPNGGSLLVANLLRVFPVALLVSEETWQAQLADRVHYRFWPTRE